MVKEFRVIRNKLAIAKNVRPFQLCTNKIIVNVATYLPRDKEQFVNIVGCGDKMYNNIGYLFVDEINKKY